MMHNRNQMLRLAALALLIAIAGAFGLRLLAPEAEAERGEGAVASAVQVRRSATGPEIVIPSAARNGSGIAVAAVGLDRVVESKSGLATVLSLQPLLEQRRALSTATAEAQRTSLAVQAARLEVKRLSLLHADDKIVSDKTLEAAQVAAATESASLANARSQITLQSAEARRQWGPVLGGWLIIDAAPLQSLFSGQAVLVQLSGPDVKGASIVRAELSVPDGGRAPVRIIGSSGQADPKFQTAGLLGIAPARASLIPGVTVPVALTGGRVSQGIAVPGEAIVRWQGQPYVYVETHPGIFAQRRITADVRTANGWLVSSGLSPGDRVVVRGAQQLLSQLQTGETGAGS